MRAALSPTYPRNLDARNLDAVPTPRTRRALLVTALVVAGALVVGDVALNLRLFVFPASSTPAHADAVVVLAGGDGERLDRGLELIRQGVSSNLVVSTGPDALCGAQHDFAVYCFLPHPDDTRGEAEAIGRIAQREGWEHLVLVTSDYHATRARLLLERCFGGTLDVSAADSGKAPFPLLFAIGHEWGGLVEAALHRDC
jgi:uncharacterized SAM-binding protein YcdF (DUF218 family)